MFESNTEAFVNVSSPVMTTSAHHSRVTSAVALHTENPFESSFDLLDDSKTPSTPPPSSISELEARTFALMARRNIVPSVDPTLHLLVCAGRRDLSMRAGSEPGNVSAAIMSTRLQLGLVRCLIRMPRARFFSVTLTDTEPASLLLERDLLTEFEDGQRGDDDVLLLGSREDVLVPITLDLRDLPMESTGIVCGVAGRLVGGLRSRPGTRDISSPGAQLSDVPETLEMSYLSTARAGTVMVAERELESALACLQQRHVDEPDEGEEPLMLSPPTSETMPIPIRGRK